MHVSPILLNYTLKSRVVLLVLIKKKQAINKSLKFLFSFIEPNILIKDICIIWVSPSYFPTTSAPSLSWQTKDNLWSQYWSSQWPAVFIHRQSCRSRALGSPGAQSLKPDIAAPDLAQYQLPSLARSSPPSHTPVTPWWLARPWMNTFSCMVSGSAKNAPIATHAAWASVHDIFTLTKP